VLDADTAPRVGVKPSPVSAETKDERVVAPSAKAVGVADEYGVAVRHGRAASRPGRCPDDVETAVRRDGDAVAACRAEDALPGEGPVGREFKDEESLRSPRIG
jgi:hypothetical protein